MGASAPFAVPSEDGAIADDDSASFVRRRRLFFSAGWFCLCAGAELDSVDELASRPGFGRSSLNLRLAGLVVVSVGSARGFDGPATGDSREAGPDLEGILACSHGGAARSRGPSSSHTSNGIDTGEGGVERGSLSIGEHGMAGDDKGDKGTEDEGMAETGVGAG